MPQMNTQDNLVFGLDIGTRNVVGTVGFLEHGRFKVLAMDMKEHETRAMLDGQIHDIYKVGETIRVVKNNLEGQLNRTLSEVCIAAAGRVLKTITVHSDYAFETETRINQEHVYSLDLIGVEKAHETINDGSSNIKFYCVGSTPVKYYLNGYPINNLEGHKAMNIGVDLIATFLPEDVVDGLYEAVGYADLNVANLTLEPIAAINVAIPEQFRLLNIALIDVGAGTSDICITRDGSISAYGMIPFAGDEITEILAKKYLVDFNTAEKIKLGASGKKSTVIYKDIMGIKQKVTSEEVRNSAAQVVDRMAKEASVRIKELNGGQPVSAVFVVGGGGKIPGYTEKLAEYLDIPKERVALRGEEVLTQVDFPENGYKKDSLFVTPVGICMNYYNQKNNFVFVQVNGQRIKLYDNNKLTVVDAIMQSTFPNEWLFPRRGKELSFSVNGHNRVVRGMAGEAAKISINGHEAGMNAFIEKNDKITISESTIGEDAKCTIGQLDEYRSTITFVVNGVNVVCPKFAYVNGHLESEYYEIQQDDVISMENYYTVAQLFEFLDIDISDKIVRVNNIVADANDKVYENFTVDTETLKVAGTYEELAESDSSEQELSDNTGKISDEEKRAAVEYVKQKVASENSAADEGSSVLQDKITDSNEQSGEEPDTHDITILVNGSIVTLKGKVEYTVVDMFVVYEFDINVRKGKSLIIKINGKESGYTEALHDMDKVEVYWDN